MDDAPLQWLRPGAEPPLEELLADPMMRALLACDRITTDDVRAVAKRARERLGFSRR